MPTWRRAGIEVVETDLGEYIIQLEGETPSHIIVPAIHKNRQQVGRLFADRLGVPYIRRPAGADQDRPQGAAGEVPHRRRRHLRGEFRHRRIGEPGPVHQRRERADGDDRAAAPHRHPLHREDRSRRWPTCPPSSDCCRAPPRGRRSPATCRSSPGTGKAGEATGAKELHIVLLDNGRTEILAGECREMLKCIRCGACMNVCPVYRTVGGHAYGWTYPGPMGMILTTLLTGMAKSHPWWTPALSAARASRSARCGYRSSTSSSSFGNARCAIGSPTRESGGGWRSSAGRPHRLRSSPSGSGLPGDSGRWCASLAGKT